jgi:hypothetical protein
MKKFTTLLLSSTTLAICLFGGARAHAASFTELKDIGQLLNVAQDVGNANEINGATGFFDDVDLYKISLDTDGMTTFDANPIKAKDGSQLNVNILLFNERGNPLASVEPREFDNMIINIATKAGIYYLGIGSDDLDALDAKGNTIAGNDSGIDMPDGILGGWRTNSESIGAYNIKISTVADAIDPTAVPTPALLPGLIALGAKVMRKKKQEETMTAATIQA